MTTTQTRFFYANPKLSARAPPVEHCGELFEGLHLRRQGHFAASDPVASVQSQFERLLNNMDLVKREEFEAVKAMAQKAREENDVLSARLQALEARLGIEMASASDSRAD